MATITTSPDPFTQQRTETKHAFDMGTPLTPLQSSGVSTPDKSKFAVVLTRMDPEMKRQYTDFKLNVRDIVAEHTEGSREYYYALLGDGKYHKIKANALKCAYPDLVEEFRQKKSKGSLPPFDPYGASVHPYSHPKIIIKGSATTSNYAEDSEVDDRAEYAFSEYNDSDSLPKLRRSDRTISGSKQKRKLAYSPRKTRSHKLFISRDSDGEDDSEVEEISPPVRRSTRRKANTNAPPVYEESDENDDYQGPTVKSALLKKKVVRGKASRPAYGNFRVVADLDFDPCSDQETASLREHRNTCEKCGRLPTHALLADLREKPKQKGRQRKDDVDDGDDGEDDERLSALGGWVRCLKCPIASHWKCLSVAQRNEILKAALDRDTEEYNRSRTADGDASGRRKPVKRDGLGPYQTTEFICNYCLKGGDCMGCKEVALKPDHLPTSAASGPDGEGNILMVDSTPSPAAGNAEITSSHELLFRCLTCKRLAHYAHLPIPPDIDIPADAVELAHHYQSSNEWLCFDCSSYVYRVDKILAWRPSPPDAVETGGTPNYKDQLPREYLVKWRDRSYKRTQWVPHMWLLSTHMSKLSNFVQGKVSRVELLKDPVNQGDDDMEAVGNDRIERSVPPMTFGDVVEESTATTPLPDDATPVGADPDAQRKIPPTWQTVDRILDILLWTASRRSVKTKKQNLHRKIINSDAELSEEEVDQEAEKERTAVFEQGEEPGDSHSMTLVPWEKMMKRKLNEGDIGRVIWVFVKWKDLEYEESSWDSPPRPGELGYVSFVSAFKRFLVAREVQVHKFSRADVKEFGKRRRTGFSKLMLKSTPDFGQSDKLQLMDFQVQGVNWLCNNWCIQQNCILADEMGLGKTVQIVVFIGMIVAKFHASPCLVVVPNSTITNWVREFERWAPHLRVVPYYGEAKSRQIIQNFEMWHDSVRNGTTGAKYHVLVTTYDTLTNQKDFGIVFKSVPRWEALVVDEGQRLKSDHSLLFKKLNELKTMSRIILTGTPLNNNIRELFNLMNFLDPEKWNGLKELEKEHEVLTEELVKSLHERLRPYFLRRIKSEVLQLPPKNEVIVPVTMTALQKEIYRSILSQNLDVLKTLTLVADAKATRNATKTNMNNTLMQLRKCLQHPYLVKDDIEPKGLSNNEAHGKLIDASAKLLLLRTMLPKLKARGHRVLIFSQFKIVLDILEDFLTGEKFKYLRLDGDVASHDRQKGIDEFNRPGSDVFIYILTTRAGGVGINLYTSDTVIIFDPDFNPHQDLQAISRAHRYGQQKPCLVFKLMVKSSAEDRIMQVGKKKLALDHVIVQTMDEDASGGDVQSILTFGAQELFQEGDNDRGIIYTDTDIDSLIDKTEKEGDQVEEQNSTMAFSFAKVWAADKGEMEEMTDAPPDSTVQGDSWAQTLNRIASERLKVQAMEVTGRGAKRKAAPVFPPHQFEDNPATPRKSRSKSSRKRKHVDSEDSDAYISHIHDSEDSDTSASFGLDVPLNDPPEDIEPFSPPVAPHTVSNVNSISYKFVPTLPSSSKVHDSATSSTDRPRIDPTASSNASTIPTAPESRPRFSVKNNLNNPSDLCALCESTHTPGTCPMTKTSQQLVEFRSILIADAGYELLNTRRAAIQAIDETLMKRGEISLIKGQPRYIIPPPSDIPRSRKKAKRTEAVPNELKEKSASVNPPSKTSFRPWKNPVAGSSTKG